MQYLLSIFGTFIVQHIFFDAFPDVPIRQCESLTPFTVVCQILADCEQVCYCPCAVSASVFRLAVVRQHKAFERHFLVRHGVEEQPRSLCCASCCRISDLCPFCRRSRKNEFLPLSYRIENHYIHNRRIWNICWDGEPLRIGYRSE